MLGVSLLFEGLSFRCRIQGVSVIPAGEMFAGVATLLETRDPTIPLVLAEDTAAIVGPFDRARRGLLATGASGRGVRGPRWEHPSSALLLCTVALGLLFARCTHGLLIGECATPEDRTRARTGFAEGATPGVVRVTQMLTLHLGPDDVVLAMKIAFRPGMSVEEVEEATNMIERTGSRRGCRTMHKIFIEADSRGDGRGVPAPRECSRLASGHAELAREDPAAGCSARGALAFLPRTPCDRAAERTIEDREWPPARG